MTFISFEGIEGSGKSTQARRLVEALAEDALFTHEPGGTAIGRSIREVLLEAANTPMTAETELLLYFADRAQHVGEVIRPALAAGRIVVSDRYIDSTVAYQGYGRGVDIDVITSLARTFLGGLWPDLTVLLEVPVETGLARVRERGKTDRMESEAKVFHERVQRGYEVLASREPSRWLRVDGVGNPDAVAARVLTALEFRGIAPGPGRVRL